MRGIQIFHQTVIRVAMALLVLLSIPFALINQVSAQSSDPAKDGRLVTFHDRGDVRVILTYAQSVSDAIDDARIVLAKEDVVEPGLDEQLVANDYTINIYRARPVIISDGTLRIKVMTAAQTAEGIMKDAGLKLQPEDITSISASTDIVADGAGEVLNIDRATKFTLDLYGTKTTTYSHKETIAEMLYSEGIGLGEKDRILPSTDTSIIAGMTVSIWREGIQTKTVREDAPFTTRYVHDVDQPIGYSKIKTKGVNGVKNVTYQIVIKNGKEVSRQAIQTVILEQPQEQVEVIGASGGLAAAMARLRQCESGGNYANKNNPRYRGAYQFSYETWANNGGYKDPADAPPALQDAAARGLYERRGWQPWPACSASLGLQDIYR